MFGCLRLERMRDSFFRSSIFFLSTAAALRALAPETSRINSSPPGPSVSSIGTFFTATLGQCKQSERGKENPRQPAHTRTRMRAAHTLTNSYADAQAHARRERARDRETERQRDRERERPCSVPGGLENLPLPSSAD